MANPLHAQSHPRVRCDRKIDVLQAPKVQQTKEAKALAAANSSKGKKKVLLLGSLLTLLQRLQT